uniref:DRBM domain-containing protein n=1 Tax=Mycena chlorophos TaxID=658473 RepID=A0ABQ0MDB6_MYCCL|nr:predicted protein [Mycena chlorophos]
MSGEPSLPTEPVGDPEPAPEPVEPEAEAPSSDVDAGTQHPRNELNNYAQRRGYTMTWDEHASGPRENETWTCTVYISGQVYGRGIASTKNAAKDAAARQALQYITGTG